MGRRKKRRQELSESESPVFVGQAIAALAQDPHVLKRTGQLLSSWELAREYGFTEYDGAVPNGAHALDWSGFF